MEKFNPDYDNLPQSPKDVGSNISTAWEKACWEMIDYIELQPLDVQSKIIATIVEANFKSRREKLKYLDSQMRATGEHIQVQIKELEYLSEKIREYL